jgi:serine/threonine protein kinase/tetratricopeptide (TPR) repeat protein
MLANGQCPNCDAPTSRSSKWREADSEAATSFSENSIQADESEAPTGYTPRNGPPAPRGARPPGGNEGPLQIGQTFGRYHIIRLLGLGGMGAVYHAWDGELSVGVALKIVRSEIASNPQAARELEKRFKRELLLARQVTHKNVVRIHDMGEIDGIKYITMPYVEGVDLNSILKENEFGLPVEQVLAVARGVVSGLMAAHHAGVVHRDLKPANIMVETDTGEALIMDFGIARSSSSVESGKPGANVLRDPIKAGLTMAGTIVGTLEYMPPEQARGQEVDHRADLYAFGLILYDMLAPGRRSRETSGALLELRQRMVKPPPALTELRPDLPAPLARIVSRLVEPEADKRYGTTAELAAAIERLDDHGNLRPLPKRFSKAFLASSAAGILAALILTWQIARTRVPPEPPPPMSVLVADFDNRTGEAVFEDSVEAALTVALEGASFISAYPRADAERLAAQLGGSSKLDEVAARLVSRREGIKVVLAGAIEPARSGYTVSIRALDPAVEDAEPLAEMSAEASDKKDVLDTVARLASRLRGRLGDTTPESVRLAGSETVSASSLEALKAYTRAQALADANRNQEALAAYQKTVKLDPNFGRAYAGMGVIYTIFKDEAKSKAAYEEALKLVDRMSDREKYRTLGTYYMSVARNYEKAIENYETLVKLYPADDGGHANLGLAYVYTGNVQRALEEARQVLDIYPSQWAQRYNYAMYSMYAGDFDTAIAEGSTVIKDVPSFELAFLPVALSKLARNDFEGALSTYGELSNAGPSGASLARFGRADLEIYRGQHHKALEILDEAIALDAGAGNSGILAQDYVAAAEAYLAVGEKNRAAAAARKATGLSAHESVLFPAALAFLDADLPEEAEKVALTLDNMLQTHTTAYARLIDAELLVRKGRYALAIETFRDSIKRRDTWFARYLLGKLYAETEHFPEAMAELELCLQRYGEVTDVFFYDTPSLRYLPPAYYWLARSQQAMGVAQAAANYEKFLALRGNADPPDPLVPDARSRVSTSAL